MGGGFGFDRVKRQTGLIERECVQTGVGDHRLLQFVGSRQDRQKVSFILSFLSVRETGHVHRGRLDLIRCHLFDPHNRRSDEDAIPKGQLSLRDSFAVHKGSVLRAQVFHMNGSITIHELHMTARDHLLK